MLTVEKVLVLKTVSIFKDIDEEALVEVAVMGEEIHAAPGETIFRRGDIGTSLYVIVHGRVRVHIEEKEIAVLGEREVFGELAALDPEPRSASVTAVDGVLLLRVEQGALYDLMSVHPEIAQGIIRVFCRRIRQGLAG